MRKFVLPIILGLCLFLPIAASASYTPFKTTTFTGVDGCWNAGTPYAGPWDAVGLFPEYTAQNRTDTYNCSPGGGIDDYTRLSSTNKWIGYNWGSAKSVSIDITYKSTGTFTPTIEFYKGGALVDTQTIPSSAAKTTATVTNSDSDSVVITRTGSTGTLTIYGIIYSEEDIAPATPSAGGVFWNDSSTTVLYSELNAGIIILLEVVCIAMVSFILGMLVMQWSISRTKKYIIGRPF